MVRETVPSVLRSFLASRHSQTDAKVSRVWRYAYQAVDQHGEVIEVLVPNRRNTASASRSFTAALASHRALAASIVIRGQGTAPWAAGHPGFVRYWFRLRIANLEEVAHWMFDDVPEGQSARSSCPTVREPWKPSTARSSQCRTHRCSSRSTTSPSSRARSARAGTRRPEPRFRPVTHGRVEDERDSTKCLLCSRYARPPNPFGLSVHGLL